MRVANCKRFDTEEKYDKVSMLTGGCRVISTQLVSIDEKLCSNEYCRFIKPLNK